LYFSKILDEIFL
jgi:hypothetical protein